jgi:hypothetical protein
MALTSAQKQRVHFFCGWSARFHSFDSRLEQALAAIETLPAVEAEITNPITGTPPGLLAQLDEKITQLRQVPNRLKASEVGSIKLNPLELHHLRSEGRRLASQLCMTLGVEKRHDVFGSSGVQTFQGFGGPESGGNFVGK